MGSDKVFKNMSLSQLVWCEEKVTEERESGKAIEMAAEALDYATTACEEAKELLDEAVGALHAIEQER